jgi:hypothetical protein
MSTRFASLLSILAFAFEWSPPDKVISNDFRFGSPAVRENFRRWTGQPGIRQTVADIMLRESLGSTRHRVRKVRPEFETEPTLPRAKPPRTRAKKQVAATSKSLSQTITQTKVSTGTSFDAAHYADSGSVPPDSMGDIGPAQFLICINGRIRSFDRNGNLDGALDTTTANFFDSVRGDGDTADPRVRYDRLSTRWFISMLSYETPTRIVIAVSSGPLITAETSFTFFQFGFSEVGTTPNSDTGSFFDFDTLGIDRHALYVGGNVFSPQSHPPVYVGSTGFVVNKADLLAGSLTVTAFRQMASNSSAGPFAPQGVDNDNPNSTEGYFIGQDIFSNDHLMIRRITDPGGFPAISANISVAIPATAQPKGGVLAFGSSFPLEDLDDRLFQARMHNASLLTGHNIEVDSVGSAGNGGGRDAVRWYEITNLIGIPTLAQSGTLFDPSPTNPRSYWMPAGTISGQGHVAIACNVAASDRYPEVAAAFRLATDAPGALGPPVVVQSAVANSNDLQNQFNQHRWGDYAAMSVDPNDDMTFWTLQEYSTTSDSWAVRVIQIKAPPPAMPVAATPSSMVQGQFNVDMVINGTSQDGSGFFDPDKTFPNHLGVIVNGGGVSVNHLTYSDPTHLTVNVTVSPAALLGSRSVTITNPDFQAISSSTGLITINASVDTDSDGIPDWWIQKYFGHSTGQFADQSRAGDDADGDSFTNLQEFHAHTDPRNAASTLRVTSVRREMNDTYITFTSVTGKSYRVESKSQLTSPNWTIVADGLPGRDDTITIIDSSTIGSLQSFYRVVVID